MTRLTRTCLETENHAGHCADIRTRSSFVGAGGFRQVDLRRRPPPPSPTPPSRPATRPATTGALAELTRGALPATGRLAPARPHTRRDRPQPAAAPAANPFWIWLPFLSLRLCRTAVAGGDRGAVDATGPYNRTGLCVRRGAPRLTGAGGRVQRPLAPAHLFAQNVALSILRHRRETKHRRRASPTAMQARGASAPAGSRRCVGEIGKAATLPMDRSSAGLLDRRSSRLRQTCSISTPLPVPLDGGAASGAP